MTGCPVIVVRPEPANSATLTAARSGGIDARGLPLFAISPLGWSCPDASDFDAILAGSANAFRHGGADLARLAALPVHCVGEATARAAREAGFTVASTGEGSLQSVLDRLPQRRLLRLAGDKRIALLPPPGTMIETRVVYAARALPVPPPLADLLAGPAVVALHSGEVARHFACECDRLGIARGRIALACLAPRIAELAGSGWAGVETAPERTDGALLALAWQMCQKAGNGGCGNATA